MKKSDKLNDIIHAFQGTPIIVFGDIMVDHYISGKAERVSPEAPVLVVRVSGDEYRLGGAGNALNNLVTLGAKVSFFGSIGNDEPGKHLRTLLENSGVDCEGLVIDESRPTTLKTRVLAQSQQVIRIDRESTEPLTQGISELLVQKAEARFDSVKGMMISDYAKGVVEDSLFAFLETKKSSTIPILLDPRKDKPNRSEAEMASGIVIRNIEDATEAAKILIEKWGAQQILMSLSEQGVLLYEKLPGSEPTSTHIPTVPRRVADVTGAGDTVCAVFTLARSVGATGEEAAVLANMAAEIVVGEVGTVPVTPDQLRDAIRHKEFDGKL
jgi:rfaE bifunctional protein kinase chain/domain